MIPSGDSAARARTLTPTVAISRVVLQPISSLIPPLMSRLVPLLLLLLVLLVMSLFTACGKEQRQLDDGVSVAPATGPIPAEDLLLEVTAGATEVELGAAFPVTVLRVWSVELAPEAWSDRALAPLMLRLVHKSMGASSL